MGVANPSMTTDREQRLQGCVPQPSRNLDPHAPRGGLAAMRPSSRYQDIAREGRWLTLR